MTIIEAVSVTARLRQGAELREAKTPLSIVRQTAIIVTGFFAYLGVRSVAIGSEVGAFENARRLLHFEDALGLDFEQAAQNAALKIPVVIDFFDFVYAWTYWPFIIGAFVVTWFWKRELFVIYRNAMVISGTIGLVIFALYPVAPPRFLPGFVDTVDSTSRSNFIAHPAGLINEFAALPSFHVGWVAMASAVVILGVGRTWLRILLLMPTVLMSISVVVTGNHYVVDIVAGLVLSLVGVVIAVRRELAKGSVELAYTD